MLKSIEKNDPKIVCIKSLDNNQDVQFATA